jgi:N-acetylmuramoyl-L-alanine amidase
MKLAICIGHSRKGDSGATSVGGVSEYTYNLNVGHQMRDRLKEDGVKCDVIAKYSGNSYGSAMRSLAAFLKEKGYTHAVELHFNAASPSAEGHEFLHWITSRNGARLAASFASAFQEAFDFSRPRKNGGLKPIASGDRGGLFLSLTHCPAVILEPFFGSNNSEWHYFSKNPDKLAECYANAITDFLK